MGGVCTRLKYSQNNCISCGQNGQPNSDNGQTIDNEPPPRPTKRKKSSIVQNISLFTEIDDHVKKTPPSAKTSVEILVEYLIQPAKTNMDRVRAIYKYIQLNISYDIQSYRRGATGPTSSKDVLRQGQSVCAGYSNLFADMCRYAGVPVKCIHGYAKGLSYDPEKGFDLNDRTNHEWNVVFLSGEWWFVDSTWGTGHVNSRLEFERRNTELYFLTDPKLFIQSHFPYMDANIQNSRKWQLLKHPINIETFNKRAKATVMASENHIKFLSHKDFKVVVQGEAKIDLKSSSSEIALQAHLLDNNGRDIKNCLMILKDANRYTIRVRAPYVGKCKLEVYGARSNNNVLDLYVTYFIHCESTDEKIRPFPDNDNIWGPVASLAEFGIASDAGKKASFVAKNSQCLVQIPVLRPVSAMVKLTYAEKQIKDINDYVLIEASAKCIVAKVTTPEVGFYKLSVYAKRTDSTGNSHDPVLSYLIENRKKDNSCKPFPKSFATSVTSYEVSLLEPCVRDLPGNTEVTFKLVSPVLKSVLAANQKFESSSKNRFEFTLKMPYKGTTFGVFGSDKDTSSYDQLYEFRIV